MAILPQATADLVARDHLPRQATADDTSMHVLYWGGTFVQSMEASAWLAQRGPLPSEPTQAEIDSAIQTLQQAAATAAADAAQLRQRVLNTLQTAVGVPFDNLTNAQLKAVVEVLAWQAGALNPDTTVRPPASWIK